MSSFLLFTLCFCHRCASAVQSDSVRHPIRFRPPPDQIPSATQSDSVRRPIRFHRCPHRGCSGLRCTNQAINQATNQAINQPINKPFNFTHQKQPYIQQNH